MIALTALGVVLLVVAAPGTAELLALTVAGLLPLRGRGRRILAPRRLAVVIPAHDEAASIAASVASVRNAEQPPTPCDVIVVADNCSDATAGAAEAAGAVVWERRDDERRGKGFALAFAFERLLQRGDVDAVLVIDADTEVAPNFLSACEEAFAAGADAVQCPYTVKNPHDSTSTELMQLAFLAFCVLRPRGRARLGLSAGLLGNGWGLSRSCLADVPYRAHSVVEDLEHHLALVRAGRRVDFVGDTRVCADMPSGSAGSDTQRARWEGGRLRMVREHLIGLLAEVVRGRLRLLEPALDLMLLPLSYHVVVLVTAVLVPFGPVRACALIGLGVVAAHVAAGMMVGGGGVREMLALAKVPAYLAWKATRLPSILKAARRDQAWIRTARTRKNQEPRDHSGER